MNETAPPSIPDDHIAHVVWQPITTEDAPCPGSIDNVVIVFLWIEDANNHLTKPGLKVVSNTIAEFRRLAAIPSMWTDRAFDGIRIVQRGEEL